MKLRKRAQFSSMFLLELILAILFFSIASAVCVQIFVKSHRISSDSRALAGAVNNCGSIAQIVSGAADDASADPANTSDRISANASKAILGEILNLSEQSFMNMQISTSDDADHTVKLQILYDSSFTEIPANTEDAAYILISEISVDPDAYLVTCDSRVKSLTGTDKASDAAGSDSDILYSQSTIHHIQRRAVR